jgi:hypothetical protein
MKYASIPLEYQISKLQYLLTHGSLHLMIRICFGLQNFLNLAHFHNHTPTLLDSQNSKLLWICGKCPHNQTVHIFSISWYFGKLPSFAHNTRKPSNMRVQRTSGVNTQATFPYLMTRKGLLLLEWIKWLGSSTYTLHFFEKSILRDFWKIFPHTPCTHLLLGDFLNTRISVGPMHTLQGSS